MINGPPDFGASHKQTSSVKDYVKEFNSLILDFKDMSEVDKLFNFMSIL